MQLDGEFTQFDILQCDWVRADTQAAALPIYRDRAEFLFEVRELGQQVDRLRRRLEPLADFFGTAIDRTAQCVQAAGEGLNQLVACSGPATRGGMGQKSTRGLDRADGVFQIVLQLTKAGTRYSRLLGQAAFDPTGDAQPVAK